MLLLACSEPDGDPAPSGVSTSNGSTGASASAGSGASGAGGASTGGGATGGAGGTAPPLEVLFIGNSYTYVNDLPARLHELAAEAETPPSIDVTSVTVGGASFQMHWSGADAQPAIADGHTHVVLQGQSVEPIAAPATFLEYGELLADAATAAGSTPVLYQTWARKAGDPIYADPISGGSPEAMQDGLTAAYATLAMETGAAVAPVGEAWRIAWTDHPEVELYAADGSHPSAAGTYLAACVVYIVLTGKAAPEGGLPGNVEPADAAALREAATQATAGR